MTMKTGFLGALMALMLGTAAFAQDQSVIDSITKDLVAAGFSEAARIEYRGDTYRVEARGPAGVTTRRYQNTTLVSEATTTAEGLRIERRFDGAGQLVSEKIEQARGVAPLKAAEGQRIAGEARANGAAFGQQKSEGAGQEAGRSAGAESGNSNAADHSGDRGGDRGGSRGAGG